MSASDTPRTDAYEFALRQFGIEPQEAETDNNGPILSMNRHARTLERELASIQAAIASKDATIARLREALLGFVNLSRFPSVNQQSKALRNALAALNQE